MSKRFFSILAFLIIFACVVSAVSQTNAQTKSGDAEGHKWWQNAVFYEIYPRSYADSNNDGIGDLKGITSKMSYLHDLGVDAIWISPCFPSPQVDFGYDVSDYENIDPMYGTLTDFDRILADGVTSRLVHLARWQGTGTAAQQLDFAFRWVCVEIRSRHQTVLLPLFLCRAA